MDQAENWSDVSVGFNRRVEDEVVQTCYENGKLETPKTNVGRRPVGRPKTRWMKGVEEALERRGTNLPQVQERETYKDRDAWRRLVKSCR